MTWPRLLPICLVLLLLMLAEAAQRVGLSPAILPAPSAVLLLLLNQPRLALDNCAATLWTATAGFFLAACTTFVASTIAALFGRLYAPVYSAGVTLQAIPIIAASPLLAVLIGSGPPLRVLVSALACQFPMLVGMMQGIRAVDRGHRDMMHVLAASRADVWRYVGLPAAMPFIFAGLKVAAPSAILGAITAEWAGADRGVGAVMLNALFSFDTVAVWLAVLMVCLMAAGAYGLLTFLESRFLYRATDGNETL